MAIAAKKDATYEDLLKLPPHVVGQIIGGELVVMPRPTFGHAGVTSTLGMDLGGPFQRGKGGPGGWWFFDEPELHLQRDVLVPDLAAWRTERMVQRPPATTPYFTVSPDWVCEVLSPSTASIDRVAKKRIYAREGVHWYWLIDPIGKTLEAYQFEKEHWLELGTWTGTDKPRVPPFDAIELELDALWSPVEPTP